MSSLKLVDGCLNLSRSHKEQVIPTEMLTELIKVAGVVLELNLSMTCITDGDLERLAKEAFPRLRTLNLSCTKVSGAGVAKLNAPSLRSLDLTEIDHSGVRLLQFRALQELHCSWCRGGNLSEELRHSCFPCLRLLDVSSNHLADKLLVSLQTFPVLEELNINNTHITDAGLEDLQRLFPRLRALILANNEITDRGLAKLECSGLRELEIGGNRGISDAGIAQLRAPALRRLSVSSCGQITGSFLSEVDYPGIQALDFDGCRHFEAAKMAGLNKFPTLEKLNFSNVALPDSGVATLAVLPNLWRLILNQTEITGATAAALNRLRTLKELDVSYNKCWNSSGAAELNLPDLRQLNLRQTIMTDQDLLALLRKCNLPSLKKLCLQGNKITEMGLLSVWSEFTQKFPNLTELDLSGNPTGPDPAGLSEALKRHCSKTTEINI